ncbi:MAG: hypothetical protein COB53_00380 [Elusimicrobia bacterium]|nr:MAG: hypothetical protein COB53_00380 [Elusimicrobiota bacterium]
MFMNSFRKFIALTCSVALLAGNPGMLAAAAMLEGVEVGPDEVTVHLSEKVKFNAFTTSEPPRLVLELLDTEHLASGEYTPGQGKYLKRVRSGQYQREPDLISRVVLYLSGVVSYRASWEGSRLKIGLVASNLPRKAAEVVTVLAAPVAAQAAEDPSADVIVLEQVDVDAAGVTLRLSDKAKFNVFATEEPRRLVIDLFDTEHGASEEFAAGRGKYVKQVRSGQYQKEPRMVSRVVLDLSEVLSYSARWEGTDLRVDLTAPTLASAAAEVVAAVAVPVAAAEVPPSDTVTLQKVDVDGAGVAVRLSGKAKFKMFTTEDPARLVIELVGTRHATTSDYIPGKGDMIRRVRSGQFQPEPDLTSRVVLYLNEVVSYGAAWQGNTLRISLSKGGGKEPSPKKKPMVVRPRSARKSTPPVTAVPVPVVAAVAPPIVSEDEASPPGAVAFEDEPEPVAAPKRQARPTSDMPTKMTTTASSELERIAYAKDYDRVNEIVDKREARKVTRVPARKSTAGKVRRDIIATLPTDLVTLDFDDMDVRDVLKLLATKAKINVVYGNEVSGTMTLHLRDVPFNEAFMTALSMEGLIPVQVGSNILRVVTPESLALQRASGINQTKIIPLRYADGKDILPSITAVRAAENRSGAVVHDLTTNSLVITDSLEGIASLERILSDLDVRPQQVLIEVKFVEVTLTKETHFGVNWTHTVTDNGSLGGQAGANTFTSEVPLTANSLNGFFTFKRVTNNGSINAVITAAANRGKAKVLSDPKLTTLDGEKANINITTQIPYVTASVTSTGVITETVTYANIGILLDVTPNIKADGRVHLELAPTVSQPSATAATAGQTGAPAIDSRATVTKVMVQDGETIVIGGLITDQVNDTVSKVPLLGDIPLIGWAFKKKSKTRTRVELLIFVTTRIINT